MPGDLAAVDVQDLPGNVRRCFQEQDSVDDVADLADASKRKKPATEFLVAVRRVHRRLDDARRDSVDRMPREAHSTASDRVAEARPPLVSAARTEGELEFA